MGKPDSGTTPTLAAALLQAVRALDFGRTADQQAGGAPVAHFPSIDLAVAVFLPGRPALWANVLFSREHPQGVAATFDGPAGRVAQVRFNADLQDAQGRSVAWDPDSDWLRLPFRPLAGGAPLRFVAPYPASLLKLMVAVGVGLAVDAGRTGWPKALEPMLIISDNDATDACVSLLHRTAMVDALNRRLAALGLATLQLNDTRADGGWRNADGAGVGHIHMTAWDTVRLLWLLDEAAPPPWLPTGTRLLSPASATHLMDVLRRQQLDEILSSGSLRGVPGWRPGLPDAPAFAHKTGTTENYASDAGIVRQGRVHYAVAVLTNLGRRYASHDRCATTWRLPALGAALHRHLESLFA